MEGKINKKADKEFDFLGLQGGYFNTFLVVVGIAFILLMSLSSFEVGIIVIIAIPVIILVAGYMVIKFASDRYGVQGFEGMLNSEIFSNDLKIENSAETYNRLK